MQTLGYQNNYNIRLINQQNNNLLTNTSPYFQGNYLKRLSNIFTLPNNKLKSYSIAEYEKLNALDKKILRLEYKLSNAFFNRKFYKNTEVIHERVSDCIKTSLDEKYGKDNYIVLTIGRSLSSIGKVLGYKIGEERVINVPLSSATRFSTKKSVDMLNNSELNNFKQYLDSLGLTKENLKSSNKKLILTDFCFSGQSLKATKNLFQSERLFGKDSNIYAEDVYNLIPDTNILYNLKDTTIKYLYESKFKQYSFVKKNKKLSEIQNANVKPLLAKKTTKLMWFKLLDNFMLGKKATIEQLKDITVPHSFLD